MVGLSSPRKEGICQLTNINAKAVASILSHPRVNKKAEKYPKCGSPDLERVVSSFIFIRKT